VGAERRSTNRPIRVLWLIKGFGAGGAERLLAMASEVRDRETFDYRAAYLLPWKDALVPDLQRNQVPVRCLEGGKEWDLRWAARLRRLLRTHPVDIVHVHSPYVASIARLVVRTIPRSFRPKLITTEHLPWGGYSIPTRLLNMATFLLNDASIAVSSSVRESMPARFRRDVMVIPNGIDLEHMRSRMGGRDLERAALGVAPDEVLVGTVANFRHQKDYPTLLRAAQRVVQSGEAIRFVAIGDGPLERELFRLHRQLGLGDRFLFLGRSEDPARVLAACDLFVLSSQFEGLPLSVIEALAMGLPVVATSVGGVQDVVTNGREAELVPVGNPGRLADTLLALARDGDRRREMRAAALSRAERFDIGQRTATLEAIYREIVRSDVPFHRTPDVDIA
jgi:glycosyltransferase involved in cell wall biosynthesis